MTKRFVIGVQGMTKDEENTFRKYLEEKGCGWWHWIDNLWLVVDAKGLLSAQKLRDDLDEIAPGKTHISIEVKAEKTWAGFGPASKEKNGKNMFNWFHKNWDTP